MGQGYHVRGNWYSGPCRYIAHLVRDTRHIPLYLYVVYRGVPRIFGGGGGRDPPNKLTTKQARDWVKPAHTRPSGVNV